VIFYDPAFIVACVIAIAFYKAGHEEAKSTGRNSAWLWTGLSVATSGMVIGVMQAGVWAVLIANVVLFLAIGAVRAALDRNK